MEKINEVLPENFSSWVAEASHELRLPIANLKLLVETLIDGAIEDPKGAHRMLDRAHQEINRLEQLVNNLLSIEQVSASGIDQKYSWILLSEHANYAVESIRSLAAPKNISIKIEVSSEFRVWADPQQFDQVLLNLLENAVKFTPPGGSVLVKSGDQPGTFGIIDTGIGIAEQDIPKIFQRFYRVDRTKSRESTGLGLSIVKHIVDLHGAKINVKSQPHEGSSFWLEFPPPETK